MYKVKGVSKEWGGAMSVRNFLVPFAAALAALTSNASASVEPSNPNPNTQPQDSQNTLASDSINTRAEGTLLIPGGDDLFKFVLKRTETGELMAYHYSHQSHRSHSSHRSHYSSRY